MTRLAGLGLLLFAGGAMCAQQQTGAPAGVPMPPALVAPAEGAAGVPAPASRVFRVHVADGRNGEAIAGARVRVWYDEVAGPGYGVATGPRGEVAMPQPVGAPIRVLVSVSGYTDCRRKEAGAPPEGYSLSSIAETGLSAQNTCGRVAVRTGPGELVLYVRSSHWYENVNRNPS